MIVVFTDIVWGTLLKLLENLMKFQLLNFYIEKVKNFF
jgi:hypothetical protein